MSLLLSPHHVMVLSNVDHVYIHDIIRHNRLNHLKFIYGVKPKQSIESLTIPLGPMTSDAVDFYAFHIHDLHAEFQRILISNYELLINI